MGIDPEYVDEYEREDLISEVSGWDEADLVKSLAENTPQPPPAYPTPPTLRRHMRTLKASMAPLSGMTLSPLPSGTVMSWA